eukprot:TRINITY_DN20460_c0_g1_i1.p1 TRINITY_DN20460_c0_g1~~TRINITY_DN20460_c0_g1_i1.p1  ORF type:complete len:370 (-),score=36.40 TRINITY_DN20460_c0_g1_i1:6-1115(-)
MLPSPPTTLHARPRRRPLSNPIIRFTLPPLPMPDEEEPEVHLPIVTIIPTEEAPVTFSRLNLALREWNRTLPAGADPDSFFSSIVDDLVSSGSANVQCVNVRNAHPSPVTLQLFFEAANSELPRRLTELHVKYAELDDRHCPAISSFLHNNSRLTTLGLEFNKIGPNGAIQLAAALGKNTTLTALNLHSNRLGDEGVSSICDALQGGTGPLRLLNLDFNEISDRGIGRLLALLRLPSCRITNLSLDGNTFSANSGYLIYDTVRRNAYLQVLSIRFNKSCTPKFIEKLELLLQRNRDTTVVKDATPVQPSEASQPEMVGDKASWPSTEAVSLFGMWRFRSNGTPRLARVGPAADAASASSVSSRSSSVFS